MRGFSLLLIGVAACSFPAITFDDGGGGGTDSVGGGGNGASTNSTGGGAADPAGGGGSGAGPIDGGGGAGGGPVDCDLDDDGFNREADGCPSMGLQFDCYDMNDQARPDQTERFPVDRGDGSFDYDCDMVQRPKYATACSCEVPESLQDVDEGDAGCGQTGTLRNCNGLLCSASGVLGEDIIQVCF